MKIPTDPLCTALEKKTKHHTIYWRKRCSANVTVRPRYFLFGAYLMDLEELRKVKSATF